MGDTVWSMLPGAQTLTPTRVMDVSTVTGVGFANVHTLQGQPRSLTWSQAASTTGLLTKVPGSCWVYDRNPVQCRLADCAYRLQLGRLQCV